MLDKKYRYITKICAVFFIAMSLSLISDKALSQCLVNPLEEQAFTSTAPLIAADLNSYVTQETAFVNAAYGTLLHRSLKRLEELEKNTENWLTDWAINRLQPILKDMMQQIAVNYIEQALMVIKVMDARLLLENQMEKEKVRIESKTRYEPSVSAGVVDTAGPGQTKTYQLSKKLGHALLKEQMDLYANKKGTAAATGQIGIVNDMWQDYVNFFCNRDRGDIGCEDKSPDLVVASKNRDISSILWGQKQTIDIATDSQRRLMKAATSYLLYPEVNTPMPANTINSPSGKEEFLKRRADKARTNILYYTITQMMSERASGSGIPNVAEIREEANVDHEKISDNPSYREIAEALNRDQFYMLDYFLNMSSKSPEQITRDQVAMGATRLQLMADLFKRHEELLLMTSADYSRDLDRFNVTSGIGSVSTAPADDGPIPTDASSSQ